MTDAKASNAESLRPEKGDGEKSRVEGASSYDENGKKKVDSDASCSNHQGPTLSDRNGSGNGAPVAGSFPAQENGYRGFMPMPFMENWPFNPNMVGGGFDFGALGPPPLVPVFLPAPLPSYYQGPGYEQHPHQGGIFAVPIRPMFGPMGGVPQGGFIPLSFSIPQPAPPPPADGQAPTATSPPGRPMEAGRGLHGEGRDAGAPDGLRQRHGGQAHPAQGARADPQRQVVRRFRVGFQLDLLLILKLAVVVFIFNQDGSKDRLMLLLFLAGIVYFYQTGALAPVLRWVSQSAQRAMMPPQQPLPVPEGGVPPVNGREEPAGANAAENRVDAPPRAPVQDGVVGQGEGAPAAVGVDMQRGPPQNPNWWGFFKEVQMIVVGFLTSLLPGFQHVE